MQTNSSTARPPIRVKIRVNFHGFFLCCIIRKEKKYNIIFLDMAQAARSNFGYASRSDRLNDLKVTTAESDLTISDEIYVATALRGDAAGNALLLAVQDQTTTNQPGSNIRLLGGTANGTSDFDGQISFESNFITSSKTTVTQATDINTTVVVTDSTGVITTQAAATVAGSTDTFTVTFADYALTTSVVQLQLGAYGGSGFPHLIVSDNSAGSFDIDIQNRHPSAALDAAMIIHYTVM